MRIDHGRGRAALDARERVKVSLLVGRQRLSACVGACVSVSVSTCVCELKYIARIYACDR
jgi:hypothetical protein